MLIVNKVEDELNDFGDYSIGMHDVGWCIYNKHGRHVDDKIYLSYTEAYDRVMELRKIDESLTNSM